MTGKQSRQLYVGDRVCWKASATDLGTVAHTGWSGLVINWDIVLYCLRHEPGGEQNGVWLA
jgi:hypothetical protein